MESDKHEIYMPVAEEIICFHNASKAKDDEASLPYHHHDAYEIYLFVQGNTYMYLEHSCYRLQPGDLIIISPGEMHRSVCIDNATYERVGLNMKRTVLDRFSSPRSSLADCFESRPFGMNNITRLPAEEMSRYIGLSHKLIEALGCDRYGGDVLAHSYLMQLLVLVNRQYQASTYTSDNLMPELVGSTMAYIKQHLTEPITSERLEQHFHYSARYISRQFREHTGLTIRSYIVDQRISLAKRWLSAGKTVTEACELSGFNDYANFIRSFTKIVGSPPGKYKAGQ